MTVSNQADLERYASGTARYIIRVGRAITVSPYGKEIRVGSNKTIVGVGTSGQIVNGGFFLGAGTSNVRNPYYVDPTAQLRQTGSILTGSSGRQETRGSAFDPRSFYGYTLDPAANVPALLRTGAGPQASITG